MLNNGLLGEYVDMLEIAESLEKQLDRIVYKIQSAAPRHRDVARAGGHGPMADGVTELGLERCSMLSAACSMFRNAIQRGPR